MTDLIGTLRRINSGFGDAIDNTLDRVETRSVQRQKQSKEAEAIKVASMTMANDYPPGFQLLGMKFIERELQPSKYFDSEWEYNAFVHVWKKVKIENHHLPGKLPAYY